MTASRHLACKVCRDRKVRCDGGRPSCEKCLQSGENCVYVSPARLSKVDLIENIASLQERLGKKKRKRKREREKGFLQKVLSPEIYLFVSAQIELTSHSQCRIET